MLDLLQNLNVQFVLVGCVIIWAGFYFTKRGKDPLFTTVQSILIGLELCLLLITLDLVKDYFILASVLIFGIPIFPIRMALSVNSD